MSLPCSSLCLSQNTHPPASQKGVRDGRKKWNHRNQESLQNDPTAHSPRSNRSEQTSTEQPKAQIWNTSYFPGVKFHPQGWACRVVILEQAKGLINKARPAVRQSTSLSSEDYFIFNSAMWHSACHSIKYMDKVLWPWQPAWLLRKLLMLQALKGRKSFHEHVKQLYKPHRTDKGRSESGIHIRLCSWRENFHTHHNTQLPMACFHSQPLQTLLVKQVLHCWGNSKQSLS